MRYLCILLMFLEDKGKEEQFVLSQFTEFIQGNYHAENNDRLDVISTSKMLNQSVEVCSSKGIIKINDGDENKFAYNNEIEVLYESTGISRYFVRNFTMNILNYNSYKDIENEEWGYIETDRGIIRRQRVYRRLMMSPIVYNEGIDDVDYDYIKKQKGSIANDLESYLNYNLHLHRNGALIVLEQEKNMKDTFPGGKAISDIVLLFNSIIIQKLKNGELIVKANDTILISNTFFENLIEELILLYSKGWTKEYREMDYKQLCVEVKKYMESFNMIKVLMGKEIEILPLTGKIIGRYPENFINGEDSNDK